MSNNFTKKYEVIGSKGKEKIDTFNSMAHYHYYIMLVASSFGMNMKSKIKS